MKLGTNFYFHGNHLQQTTLNGSVQKRSYFIKQNLYEFKGYEANRLMKEFVTKG